MFTAPIARLAAALAPAPAPVTRIVAESEWGHVAIFTDVDFPAARRLGWVALGTVSSARSTSAPRHARRLAAAAA